jgi:hypothetical protein
MRRLSSVTYSERVTTTIPWCAATADLTPAELVVLDEIPEGHNELKGTIFCTLQDEHLDPHISMGQAYSGGECWLRWDGNTVRELFRILDEEFCPAEDADSGNVCLLPGDHFGRHNFCLD